MLTTAKSIQLLDASGMNISPITDITSLYYEVANSSNSSIISRKYVYTGFPVTVNITGEATSQIGVSINTSEKRHPVDGSLYENGQFRKIIDGDRNDDILISRIDTNIIPGTTYRQINVTNYNLSEILSYYTPLDLMDASYGELITDISIINSSIDDVSNRIYNLRESLDASNATLSEIINWSNNALIPNKFYLINDYYAGDGCMALPDSEDFSGPDSDNSFSLLVKANDVMTLDRKLYEMYDHNGNALKVYGTYKLEDNNTKVRITLLKDQYGNEAPYDFYNLKYNDKFTFNKSNNASNYLLIIDSIKNNIIKSDPYSIKKQITICSSSNGPAIYNNYIGYNSIINIDDAAYINTRFYNNIIYNDCSIYIKGNASACQCINSIINSNNIINLNGATVNNTQFLYVNSNNIININCIANSNFVIGSSNNITLYGTTNYNNVTILNNCDGSINLSDNIIVDNYIDNATNSSLNTTQNSVYLFGQDVYAKSFNTLK